MGQEILSELSLILGLARAGVTITEEDSQANKLFREIQYTLDKVIAVHYDETPLDNLFGPES